MLFGRRKKKGIEIPQKNIREWIYTTCGYCSTGCGIEVGIDSGGAPVACRGIKAHPVNDGRLCCKGILEYELFASKGRGKFPLLREKGNLQRASWDAALDKTVSQFKGIQEKYGRDSIAVISTGQLYTEEFYTLGKLVRGVIGTNNYDGNTTLCMASAVSGYKRSFGSDGPPGCYDDFDKTGCLLAVGSNLTEQHPLIFNRLRKSLDKKKFPLIVIDPRVTMLAQMADYHLPVKPGTDLVLLNAFANLILAEGLEKSDYIKKHTTGFDEFQDSLKKYTPEHASSVCGIDAGLIRKAALLYARAESALAIWTMGINQSVHGSDSVVAINNLALITGNVGKEGGSPLSITGQCNAMGTREFSSCSGLPGYRTLENREDRKFMAEFWGIDESFFPQNRGLAQTDIFPEIEKGNIRGLWIIATNPLTSMPDTGRIKKALEKLEFLVVQDCYEDVETVRYADVYLPAAMWAEKTGVMTNTERRVNLINKVVDPPGEARPDFLIFNDIARRFDRNNIVFPATAKEIFEEIKILSKNRLCDYSGMSYELMEKSGGLQWPMSEKSSAGNQRLYSDGLFEHKDRKARLIPLQFECRNELPDKNYPFVLNTGRVVEHFHTRTKTGKIENLNKFSPVAYLEINPDAAIKLGIGHMDKVRIISGRGEAVALAQLTARVAPDSVFIPFHFHNVANVLSLGLLDPFSRQPAYKQSAVRIEKVLK